LLSKRKNVCNERVHASDGGKWRYVLTHTIHSNMLGVGKTSLTVQLTEGRFDEEYNPTIGKIIFGCF